MAMAKLEVGENINYKIKSFTSILQNIEIML